MNQSTSITAVSTRRASSLQGISCCYHRQGTFLKQTIYPIYVHIHCKLNKFNKLNTKIYIQQRIYPPAAAPTSEASTTDTCPPTPHSPVLISAQMLQHERIGECDPPRSSSHLAKDICHLHSIRRLLLMHIRKHACLSIARQGGW